MTDGDGVGDGVADGVADGIGLVARWLVWVRTRRVANGVNSG